MTDIMGRAYRKQYGCNFVTVIPCNAYGPNDSFNIETGHVIPSIIHKCYLAKKHNTSLDLWGTGKSIREFIYSKDLGYLANWVLENYDDITPLILSADEEISIDSIAKEICYQMNFSEEIIYNGEKEGQFKKPSDNSKLKDLIPGFRFTSIESGIQETIAWFLENYETCRK
jgi:GDP-L-fucose synthase